MFEWYTGFEDFLNDGIAEACYWIGYKKSIQQDTGLEDKAREEGLDLVRVFVNDRASLYRYRDELIALTQERAKALEAGDSVEVTKLEARLRKFKGKALMAVWRILENRQELDDWVALEGIPEQER